MFHHGATLLPLQLVTLLSVVHVATPSQCDLASLCSDPNGCGGLLFAKVSVMEVKHLRSLVMAGTLHAWAA